MFAQPFDQAIVDSLLADTKPPPPVRGSDQ
jgi:hypothetical protein